MNILILGDIFGIPGVEAIKKKLPKIIIRKKIDFVIANGENAADNGLGITKKNAEDFFNAGINVITSGNHIWDQKETQNFIEKEKRLLRPENSLKPVPGKGNNIFVANNKKKIAVINLMGNVFMKKSDDVFVAAKKFISEVKLKKDADFIVVDFHGEITSEKMAAGHFFDGNATCVVGTHTHVPTADTRILDGGTAYQTDIGMCGDYNSVIGMNKENSIKRFLKEKDAVSHFPAEGNGTLSGVIVESDFETGLAKKIKRVLHGGVLTN